MIDDLMYSPEQVVADLRGFGFNLFVGEDGVVHGRPKRRGMTITLEMRAVIDRLQTMNDKVADIIRNEPRRMEYEGITVDEAVALGQRIRSGEILLDGKVTFHRSTGLCDLAVIERSDGA